MTLENNQIDCARFQELLPDLDRPGTDGIAFRDAVLAHAESCSDCALLLTESESLDFALHSLSTQDSNRTAPPRVETAVLQRFRRETGLAARRRLQLQVSALGIAAAVLLAFGVLLHRSSFLPQPHPSSDAARLPSASAQAHSSAPSASQAVAPQDAQLQDANFIPLPFADDPAALDDGAVVRVLVSPRTLAAWGLPIDQFDSEERIPADLILSQDGTPEAIRLVSQTSSE
jgi:hypothetical protein